MTDAIDFLEDYLKGRGKMEAKDTVVPVEIKDLLIPSSQVQSFLKVQAEISFKAGIKTGYSAGLIDGQYTNHKRHGKKMLKARQEGMKEVIEYLKSNEHRDILTNLELLQGQELLPYKRGDNNSLRLTGYCVDHFRIQGLHHKLKEWGIE